jgi:hypothetical protein
MYRLWLRRKRHDAFVWVIWKLPRSVIYWAFIRLWAHGTTGQYGNTHPDDLTWSEALKRWGE